jgi:hypothetical protein
MRLTHDLADGDAWKAHAAPDGTSTGTGRQSGCADGPRGPTPRWLGPSGVSIAEGGETGRPAPEGLEVRARICMTPGENLGAIGRKVLGPMEFAGMDAARRRRGGPMTAAINLAASGREMTEKEAADLESRLVTDPDDLTARIKLLGYYFTRQFASSSAREARSRHILWIIKHRPDEAIAFTPYLVLDPDEAAYAEAKRLWLEQLAEENPNPEVAENAAVFMSRKDPAIARDIWQRIRR